jgi:short-subunit dehydrogenase
MPSNFILLLLFLAVLVAIPLQTHKDNYDKEDIQQRYGEWGIVAGASEGLGAAWAELLCEYGLNVLLIARRQHSMDELANKMKNKHGCQVDTLVQDLNDPNHLQHIFSTVLEEERNYGLLVYNAASVSAGHFLDTPLEDQYKAVNVNIQSVLTLSHIFGNKLKTRNRTGGIILMSSVAGFTGCASIANYAASKAWNTQFAHGLYMELQPLGIDVLACVAGATLTPNYLKFGGKASDLGAQTPEEVTQECFQALGKVPSLATGPINKAVRFFFARLLPPFVSLRIISMETEKRKGSS